MNSECQSITLYSPQETDQFARALGGVLAVGDCILLDGPIGSGKTHLARCLIQHHMAAPEDVPSPTYTLVQTYDTLLGDIWHADLYRITDPDEIEELGLVDAFSDAICLVEWPDRLAELRPENALYIRFVSDKQDEKRRDLELQWSDPKWSQKLRGLA